MSVYNNAFELEFTTPLDTAPTWNVQSVLPFEPGVEIGQVLGDFIEVATLEVNIVMNLLNQTKKNPESDAVRTIIVFDRQPDSTNTVNPNFIFQNDAIITSLFRLEEIDRFSILDDFWTELQCGWNTYNIAQLVIPAGSLVMTPSGWLYPNYDIATTSTGTTNSGVPSSGVWPNSTSTTTQETDNLMWKWTVTANGYQLTSPLTTTTIATHTATTAGSIQSSGGTTTTSAWTALTTVPATTQTIASFTQSTPAGNWNVGGFQSFVSGAQVWNSGATTGGTTVTSVGTITTTSNSGVFPQYTAGSTTDTTMGTLTQNNSPQFPTYTQQNNVPINDNLLEYNNQQTIKTVKKSYDIRNIGKIRYQTGTLFVTPSSGNIYIVQASANGITDQVITTKVWYNMMNK